jgi:hypothetical protein
LVITSGPAERAGSLKIFVDVDVGSRRCPNSNTEAHFGDYAAGAEVLDAWSAIRRLTLRGVLRSKFGGSIGLGAIDAGKRE